MTETEQTPSETPITDAKAFDSDTGNEVVRADDCRAIERAANALYKALLPIPEDFRGSNGHFFEEDNWNPNYSETVELKVSEYRAIASALAAFTSLRTKGAQDK